MHVKAVTIEIDEREKNPRFLYWHLSLFLSEKLNTDCFTYINNLKASTIRNTLEIALQRYRPVMSL